MFRGALFYVYFIVLLVVPRISKPTKGGRAFSYLAPELWNSLPGSVQGSVQT